MTRNDTHLNPKFHFFFHITPEVPVAALWLACAIPGLGSVLGGDSWKFSETHGLEMAIGFLGVFF
jgi:hypothetical protein